MMSSAFVFNHLRQVWGTERFHVEVRYYFTYKYGTRASPYTAQRAEVVMNTTFVIVGQI